MTYFGNCNNLKNLLHTQHEYSKFCTLRERIDLGSDDDFEYCIKILSCVDNIDIEPAKKEILELMEYNYDNGSYDGYEWDYNQLDEILIKYIGIDLYDTDYHLLSRLIK